MDTNADLAAAEHDALISACNAAQLDSADAHLISLGDSATFRLANRIVARVTRSPDQQPVVHKEVAVAHWLADAGIPAVRTAAAPVHVGTRRVVFWHELPTFRTATPAEISNVLVRLHNTDPPTNVTLADVEPFVRIAERIHAAPISQSDAEFLASELARLRQAWETARFELDTSVIHGDPHADNIVTTEDGTVVILDLERFALGPPEWDLTLMASEYDSFRWITEDQYRSFVEAYGYDVLKSPAYPVLRDLRELRMTSWLANKADQNEQIAIEVAQRISCLRGHDGDRPWEWMPW